MNNSGKTLWVCVSTYDSYRFIKGKVYYRINNIFYGENLNWRLHPRDFTGADFEEVKLIDYIKQV